MATGPDRQAEMPGQRAPNPAPGVTDASLNWRAPSAPGAAVIWTASGAYVYTSSGTLVPAVRDYLDPTAGLGNPSAPPYGDNQGARRPRPPVMIPTRRRFTFGDAHPLPPGAHTPPGGPGSASTSPHQLLRDSVRSELRAGADPFTPTQRLSPDRQPGTLLEAPTPTGGPPPLQSLSLSRVTSSGTAGTPPAVDRSGSGSPHRIASPALASPAHAGPATLDDKFDQVLICSICQGYAWVELSGLYWCIGCPAPRLLDASFRSVGNAEAVNLRNAQLLGSNGSNGAGGVGVWVVIWSRLAYDGGVSHRAEVALNIGLATRMAGILKSSPGTIVSLRPMLLPMMPSAARPAP